MKKVLFPVKVILLLLTMGLIGSNLVAQDLEETLTRLSADAASAYVKPIASGFGADLNSGWVTRVPEATKFSFNISFGVVAMGTFFGDPDRTFSSEGTFRFNQTQANQLIPASVTNPATRQQLINIITNSDIDVGLNGPTIVGSKTDNVKIEFKGGTYTANNETVNLPAQEVELTGVGGILEDLPLLPLAAPQLSVGTVYGTELAIRFLPSIKINDDLGEFSYFGIGVNHNVGQWIPTPIPVDISVGIFTQSLKVGDFFKSSAFQFGVFAGKTFGAGVFSVSPYLGLSMESSSMEVSYDFKSSTPAGDVTVPIKFELEGENSFRLRIGTSFNIAVLKIFVDYNLAKYNSVSAGIGFGF